jgi:hypothetical protein
VAALPPPQSPTLKFPITELVPGIRAECLEMLASIGPRRRAGGCGGWMVRRAMPRLCCEVLLSHERGLGRGRHESYAVNDVRQET